MRRVNYWIAFSLMVLMLLFNAFTLDSAIRGERKHEIIYFSIFAIITFAYILFLIIRGSKLQNKLISSIVVYCAVAAECIFIIITNYSSHINYYYMYKKARNFVFRNEYKFFAILLLSISIVMIVVNIIIKYIVQNERIILYRERQKEKKEMMKKLETLKHKLEMEKLNKEYEKLKRGIGE